VFRQLDTMSPWQIVPFGRVRSGALYGDSGFKSPAHLELVGTDTGGNLVKAVIMSAYFVPGAERHHINDTEDDRRRRAERRDQWQPRLKQLAELPLIVLAGLR
jgi:hypothetical protein